MVLINYADYISRVLIVLPLLFTSILLLSSDDKIIQFENQLDVWATKNEWIKYLVEMVAKVALRKTIAYVMLSSILLISRWKWFSWLALVNAGAMMFVAAMEAVNFLKFGGEKIIV